MAEFMKPAPEPKTALGYHRPLSSSAGIRVSPLALGAMSIGDAWSFFMGSLTKEQAFQLLDAFYDAGGNFIDTANDYQYGQSETWIGEWMAARGNRDQMVIATKWSFHYKDITKEDKTPANNNFWGNHKRSLHMSLRDSLKKMQTDYVDVLYLHFWDYTTSIPELMNSLQNLIDQGKVMYLGISDTPAWVVAACNEYAIAHGKTPFSVYQGRWNVLVRDLERDILPMALHYGMAVAPWDVLGSGKLRSEEEIAAKTKSNDPSRSGSEQTEDERKVSQVLTQIGKSHGIKSVPAVALAYVRSKAPNVIPIVGGRKVEHLLSNIRGLEFRLSAEEIKQVEGVKDFDIGFPGNFIGQDWRISGESSLAAISQGPVEPPQKWWA